jgi:hypothetical protein
MIKIETDINEYLSCIINFIYNFSLSYNCAFKVKFRYGKFLNQFHNHLALGLNRKNMLIEVTMSY